MVVAGVDVQLGRKRDSGAEPEDRREEVDGKRYEWHAEVLDSGWDEVEQEQHGPGGAEHGVVVYVRVRAHGDGVSDESHDEQGHEELQRAQSDLDDVCHCDGGGSRCNDVILAVCC